MGDSGVTITSERYDELSKAEEVLDALYAAGVDNWDGYDFAMEDIKNNQEK